MPPEAAKNPKKAKGLRSSRKSPDKAHRILARSHISHGRLIKIIEAYSRWENVGMAAKASGVSRLTVGRVYNLIRKRLLDFHVYQSDRAYRNLRYDMENDEEEGQPWYDEEDYQSKLAQALGRYRGINPEHRPLYEAEAVYRVTHPTATQGDVKTLVMEAIKKGGPLNEKPHPEKILDVYLDRVVWPEINNAFRLLLKLTPEAEELQKSGAPEPDIDIAAYHARLRQREGE